MTSLIFGLDFSVTVRGGGGDASKDSELSNRVTGLRFPEFVSGDQDLSKA